MRIIIKSCVIIFMSVFFNHPLLADILMQGGYSHEFVTTPGGSYQGSIKLQNVSSKPQEVKIYLEDYMFNAGGKSKFTTPRLRKNQRSNASWIQVNTGQLTIPAQGEQTVNYRIKVPNSGVSGTYWSALIVEPISPSSPEASTSKPQDKNVHMTIQQVSRHAVQIVTQIGGTGAVKLNLKNPSLKKHDNQRFFSLDAYNTGTRWIKPNVWLDIYSQQGTYIGKFNGDGARVYPNTSATFSVDVSALKKGSYKGLFVVDDERSEVLGTDVNLTIK